ncbi:hypothetical protein [Roseovarius indicus]|uniref:Uncharacterized protein n=1 Tax=Roseovarius indicus TaxID=540747 RepID=A0A5P3AJZ5_9RHOB|nr:hypothetical protein [Roseovarius indicus]QEW28678.1 hypothetical protein RIdsm_04516 [Roseovarius indicus]SFE69079.1 hypothetical protein SAMN04488031_11668 [Roseovarius indicus]
MLIEKLGFDDVRYNPELSAFEALVQIREEGEVYSYPVHMLAPLNAEFDVIAKGLSDKALRIHRHAPDRAMRLRRAPVPGEAALQLVPVSIETGELRRNGAALAA